MTNADAVRYIALRYAERHPEQMASVEAVLISLEAGTFILKNSPRALAALDEAIAFLQAIEAVGLPALIAQLQALETRGTPV